MSDIEERVKKIVVEHLGVEESKIQSDSKFIDDLGADSLDTVELVMAFEEEFGCEIPDDAASLTLLSSTPRCSTTIFFTLSEVSLILSSFKNLI